MLSLMGHPSFPQESSEWHDTCVRDLLPYSPYLCLVQVLSKTWMALFSHCLEVFVFKETLRV